MKKITIRQITLIGVMAAAVYVTSAFLQIPIPLAIGNTRLHMGNVMCLLSGMLLGPISGGFASGLGSMFFDLTNPIYIASAPFTFAFKFIMAWLCGMICKKNTTKPRLVLGASLGAFAYVLLYIGKSYIEDRFVLGLPVEAVILTVTQKAVVSSTNAIVSILVAVSFGIALQPVLEKVLSTKSKL